ncbi:MmgE/PrpD family protein [Salinisphaera sp. T31B1]|uniref:MmgE/PrpD family protein n=1 Tax=Salinisphaera sp. T31B1 TaxID=727963 RepID=UPI00333EF1F7
MTDSHDHGPTWQLADFCATLRYDDIPDAVVARCEDLFLDWLASALGGASQHPIPVFERHAQAMGPASGPSEIVTNATTSSPYYAAFVNAAASHVIEQDDLHNSSVLHPATVVFPAALAAAQDVGASGQELIAASVAGYEAGIRVGEFLGRSHYRVFHTTGTAGTLAAAVATARILNVDTQTMIHTLGNAGTQAAGLWAFLRDGADSKQLHTAKAAGNGLLAAYMARDGLTGAQDIFGGSQGMAAGMSSDADIQRLAAKLGSRWALAETSFKFHASCRHTHPAADALAAAMAEHDLAADDIERVTTRVHQGAIDVLGAVDVPRTIHQAKFSMGTVLGLIAVHDAAGLTEFDTLALTDDAVAAFRDKVSMRLDDEVDTAYPNRWLGRVEIETTDGRHLEGSIDEPKGDPGNTLSRAELEDKFMRLAAFGGRTDENAARTMIDTVWGLRELSRVPTLRPH